MACVCETPAFTAVVLMLIPLILASFFAFSIALIILFKANFSSVNSKAYMIGLSSLGAYSFTVVVKSDSKAEFGFTVTSSSEPMTEAIAIKNKKIKKVAIKKPRIEASKFRKNFILYC